jgi:hypothetical protein
MPSESFTLACTMTQLPSLLALRQRLRALPHALDPMDAIRRRLTIFPPPSNVWVPWHMFTDGWEETWHTLRPNAPVCTCQTGV